MNKEEALFLKSLTGTITEDISECDIAEIFKLAARHNVLALCYENISNAQGFDKNRFQKLQTKIYSIVFSQTKRTANFKKIYRILLENGIKPLVLKGIICRNLYGELCDHRPSGDEDILVKKEDFFKVQDILIENDYIPEEKVTLKSLSGIQEITFKNKNGLNIEVHLNIIGTENSFRQKMNDYFKNVFENAIEIEIDGQSFQTLSFTEHYIFLFYHIFKHFATTGVGVRQIVDLLRFSQVYGNKIDWDKVYNAVESINAQGFYGDIVAIGNEYLGFDLENQFGTTIPDRLIEDIFSAGAYGNETTEQIGSKVKVMAALDSGKEPSKLKMLFPSLESMREFYKVLYEFPFLLPLMWIWRIIRYIFRSRAGKTYNVSKSETIADTKIKLLKDYHIIR